MAVNREIVFVLKVKNEARAAMMEMARELASLNKQMPGGSTAPGSRAPSVPRTPAPAPAPAPSPAPAPRLPSGGGTGGSGPSLPGLPELPALLRSAAGEAAVLASRFLGAASAVGLLSVGMQQVVMQGDAATMAVSRLNNSLDLGRDIAKDTFDQLQRGAQATGTSLDAALQAFVRFNLAGSAMGKNRAEMLSFTQTIQKLGVISGVSGGEMSAAMLQLGQGLASGVLQGDELRSILENFPQIAQLIAREMGVGIGQLKKLGEEGKITSDKIFDAVKAAQEDVDRRFRLMPLTVTAATTSMMEGFSNLARRIDEKLGSSSAVAAVFKALGDGAQNMSEAMKPETALQGYERVNRALTQLRATMETMPKGVFGGYDNAAGQQARVAALQQELKQLGLLAEMERQNAMAVEAHESSTNAARAAEYKRTLTVAAVKEAQETLGISTEKYNGTMDTLKKLLGQGDEALAKFGLTSERVQFMIDGLKEKASGLAGVMRQLRDDIDNAAVASQGDLAVELNRRLTDARQKNGGVLTPEQEREVRDGVGRLQANRAEPSVQRAEREARLAEARARDAASGRGVRTSEHAERRRQLQEDAKEFGYSADQLDRYNAALDAQFRAEQRIAAQGASGARSSATRDARKRVAEAEAEVAAAERGVAAQAKAAREAKATVEAERAGAAGTASHAQVRAQLIDLYGREEQAKARLGLIQQANTARDEAEVAALRLRLAEQGKSPAVIDAEAQALERRQALVAKGVAVGSAEERQLNLTTAALKNKADTEARAAVNQNITATLRQLQQETELLTLSGTALERRRILLDAENDAWARGVTLKDEDRKRLEDGLEVLRKRREEIGADPWLGVQRGLGSLSDDTNNLAKSMEDVTVRSFNSMQDAVTEFAKTGKLNFRDFASSVVSDMIRIAAQQSIVRGILSIAGSFLGGGGGEVSAGAAHTAASTSMSNAAGGFGFAAPFHTGGIVGPDRTGGRLVSSSAWNGAKRFHTGGIVGGLGTGERAIIAKDNEAVMPTVRLPDGTFGVKALGGGGGGTNVFAPTITVNVQGGSGGQSQGQGGQGTDRAMAEEVSRQVSRAMQAAMADFTRDQARPGGMLNPGRTY